MCWGFLSAYQKKKHLEHSVYTLTPAYFKNEEMFMKHAKTYHKIKDNDTMVAIFSDTCKVLVGNPYLTSNAAVRPALP